MKEKNKYWQIISEEEEEEDSEISDFVVAIYP